MLSSAPHASAALALLLTLLTSACVVDLERPSADLGIEVDQAPPADLPAPDLSLCGNGKLDPGERCDTAIPTDAQGHCPRAADCPRPDVCVDPLEGQACQSRCTLRLITQCADGDGCCPPGCERVTDGDCPDPDLCGNGKLDSGESCDGDCPTSCPPKVCNSGQVIGEAKACTARCLYTPSTDGVSCVDTGDDGQCRAGSCCTTCWDGESCRVEVNDAFCGTKGVLCVDCEAQGKCCSADSCGSCP
jgi:hypothetical protein